MGNLVGSSGAVLQGSENFLPTLAVELQVPGHQPGDIVYWAAVAWKCPGHRERRNTLQLANVVYQLSGSLRPFLLRRLHDRIGGDVPQEVVAGKEQSPLGLVQANKALRMARCVQNEPVLIPQPEGLSVLRCAGWTDGCGKDAHLLAGAVHQPDLLQRHPGLPHKRAVEGQPPIPFRLVIRHQGEIGRMGQDSAPEASTISPAWP